MIASSATQAKSRLHWYWHLVAICAATAIVFSRQPEAFLHPQFFAEDGSVWFADAYNRGWFASLFRPQDGYFQTLPRLAAALALLPTLRVAPAVMNFAGLVVQIMPVPLLLSRRLSTLGSLPLRAMLALAYLALPNSAELNVSVEEAQWHLALVGCLLILGTAPSNRAWKLFDLVVLLLCGLTGPFALLLLPVALLRWWLRRESWSLWQSAVLGCTAVIQVGAMILTHRNHWPLGANVQALARIMAGQVFLGATLGSHGWTFLNSTWFANCVAVAGTALVLLCVWRACLEWKLFLLFSVAVFAACVLNPFIPRLRPGTAAWAALAASPGIRYWFFPALAFVWTLIWYAFGYPADRLRRSMGALLLIVMLRGAFADWRIPPPRDLQFAPYADALQDAAPGTEMVIPENPEGWTIRLVKH